MTDDGALLRRGRRLEYATLAWNVAGVGISAWAAIAAGSIALGGFGLDSLIEIGASTVVLWELADIHHGRRGRALRLIGVAFAVLAAYLAVQSSVLLALGDHPAASYLGMAWTGSTAVAMFALARGKAAAGRALDNPVLQAEGKVTAVDGVLAAAVLVGLVLNAGLGWWWADPSAAYVLVYYGAREALLALTAQPERR